jgi:hypothetical protein
MAYQFSFLAVVTKGSLFPTSLSIVMIVFSEFCHIGHLFNLVHSDPRLAILGLDASTWSNHVQLVKHGVIRKIIFPFVFSRSNRQGSFFYYELWMGKDQPPFNFPFKSPSSSFFFFYSILPSFSSSCPF